MKRFDFDAIRQRLMKSLTVKMEWNQIIQDGVISNLIDVYSEGEQELARYLEYLLNEKKWSTAQNLSSLVSMGKLISRKRRRPVSAVGYVIVSHTDIEGNHRLNNYGRYFYDLDELSNYDDITKSTTYTSTQSKALVPWTGGKSYIIPKYTKFISSSGIEFISTQAVISRSLSNGFSYIQKDEDKYQSFIKNGGWNGIKYVRVPVIQGIIKEVNVGISTEEKFQTFSMSANNVEDASNSISENFFYVTVTSNNGEEENWVEIENIRLAGPYDKVFECITSDDGETLIIKFGDGISGRIPTSGNSITVHYLETLGEDGNVDSKYQITSMSFPKNVSMIDPRTNVISDFLSCTNNIAIQGGKSAEDADDYRNNAPTSYVKSYTTATRDEYETKIFKYSPLSLLKVKVFSTTDFSIKDLSDETNVSDLYSEISNEYTVIKNVLKITAIQSNGEKIEDPEETFIKPLLESLANIKGPNDSFVYEEPEFIKVAVGIIVNTSSLKYSEEEIKAYVKQALLDKYSIYNTDFNKPFYKSVLVAQSKNFPFSDSVSVNIEALADINYDGLIKTKIDNSSSTSNNPSNWIIAIPFNFNTIYSDDLYNQGFKNYTVNSGFLIKADIKFNNNAFADLNKTVFLIDNRIDTGTEMPSIEAAKGLAIDKNIDLPNIEKIINIENFSVSMYDDTSELFYNRQTRTAQFDYLTNITDDNFMIQAKDFALHPYENRPYITDSLGNNKVFDSANVDTLNRASIKGTDTTNICYQINKSYTKYIDIVFNENYDEPLNGNYACGYLICPLDYFNLDLTNINLNDSYSSTIIANGLKSNVSIKISARPKMEDFSPSNINSIMFVDDDDIKVERHYIGE